MEANKRPVVFNYLNYREFLSDYYESRRKDVPSFSKGDFSREVFCFGRPKKTLKHRGYLSDIVVKGENITSNTVVLLIQAFQRDKSMNFGKDEIRYFRTLVSFCQAANADERELHFHHLISLNHSFRKILGPEALSLYSEWHHGVIRALIDVFDFNGDYAALAKRVFPPITVKKARESIKLLSKLGLIAKNESGFWKPTEKSISAPSLVQNELIIQYQLTLLEFAKLSLLENHSQPQNISTNTISLSDEAFAILRERLNQFKSEARTIVSKDDKPARRVYQINIQLFPASREVAV